MRKIHIRLFFVFVLICILSNTAIASDNPFKELMVNGTSFTKESGDHYVASVAPDHNGYHMEITPYAGDTLKLLDMSTWEKIPLTKHTNPYGGYEWWTTANNLMLKSGTHKYSLEIHNGSDVDRYELDIVVDEFVSLKDIIENVHLITDCAGLFWYYGTDLKVSVPKQVCLLGDYSNKVSNDIKIVGTSLDDRLLLAFGDSNDFKQTQKTVIYSEGKNEQRQVTTLKVKDKRYGSILAVFPVFINFNNPVNRLMINGQAMIPHNYEVTYVIAQKHALENFLVTIDIIPADSEYLINFDTGNKNIEKATSMSMQTAFSDSKENLLNYVKQFDMINSRTGETVTYTVTIKHKWTDDPDSLPESKKLSYDPEETGHGL